MTFEISDRKDKRMFKSDRTLYLNSDQTAVVEEGDPGAAFLLVRAGGEIDGQVAERYGLKERAPAEDKAVSAPEDDKSDEPADEPADDTDEGGDELACPEDGCDFVAKSAGGLTRHVNAQHD